MVHPYRLNILNALILISAGLIEYFSNPAKPPSALIPPAFGLLLLACTHLLRKHNRFVFSTVTALTILVAVLTLLQLDLSNFNSDRRDILLLVMGLSSLISATLFVLSYFRERRQAQGAVRKENL